MAAADRSAELAALAEVAPADRERAFDTALAAAADAAPPTRAAAARAIAAVGDPSRSLDALAKLATDADVGVRFAATAALANTVWRGRLDLLAARLDDDDLGVRALAAEGLAHANDARGADVLREAVTQKKLRFDALEALLALRDPVLTEMAPKLVTSFFVPPFEKALAEVVLATNGDAAAKASLRTRLGKKRAEERPFVLVHLARVDPTEGRALVEAIATDEQDYLRESALLALTKLDAAWWARTQEAIGRFADSDPHVAGEVLLGLFDLDWSRASLSAAAHVSRDGELGAAARRVRLQAALRSAHPSEVLLRCP